MALEETSNIAEIMSWPPLAIFPSTRVREAALLAQSQGVHHLAVVQGDQLVGVLCSCDLLGADAEAEVVECMTALPEAIQATTTAGEAARRMLTHQLGCLPVLEGDRLVGMLTRGDLLRAQVLRHDDVTWCAECHSHHHVRQAQFPRAPSLCVECADQLQPLERFQLSQDPWDDD